MPSEPFADVERLIALFDELNIRATDQSTLTDVDGTAADRAIIEFNRVSDDLDLLRHRFRWLLFIIFSFAARNINHPLEMGPAGFVLLVPGLAGREELRPASPAEEGTGVGAVGGKELVVHAGGRG